MLTWFREKFGKIIVTVVVALIALVFAVEGIFFKSPTRGLHEGAVAGTVNGESISLAEFNRALNQQAEFFKNMMGGKPMTEEQMRMFRVHEMTFQGLVRKKLLLQEAEKQGRMPSDEEIRDRIRSIPGFQKDGKFDYEAYQATLNYNHFTPASYESLVREELIAQAWQFYFRDRVKISDNEVRQYFEISQDQRKLKYVLLTNQAGLQDITVSQSEKDAYLKDPAKFNLVKTQYEQSKASRFKGKTLDEVKNEIAGELIASSQTDVIRKNNEKIAETILPLLKTDAKSDATANALLKRYKAEVKTTGSFTRLTTYLPGIGEAKDLMADVFPSQGSSPIDLRSGGRAKKYTSANWVLVAAIVDSEKPNLATFDLQKPKLIQELTQKKERELFDNWIKHLTEKSKIVGNPAVVGGAEGDSSQAG